MMTQLSKHILLLHEIVVISSDIFLLFFLSNIGYFYPLRPLKINQMKQSEKKKKLKKIKPLSNYSQLHSRLFVSSVKSCIGLTRGRGGQALPNKEQ